MTSKRKLFLSSSSTKKKEVITLNLSSSLISEFVLNPDATTFLQKIKGPIGLVAVAGMYRTGKSYLLNRMLLNRSNGFGVGPTINPCTKGLWIWGKPVAGFTPEGEPINVLIVDTEGLGALDEDSNHDVRIFSLAILLCSYFLYNSVGSIDESALQNLSLVVNLTKHIQIKTRGGEDVDTEEYANYFPSFMWVVRDFTLQLVDQDGEQITSKDYFEKALEMQKGFSDNVEAKNRIRRLLKSFFKERDCCTMIRPLTNEENLQNLANMDLDELRADFVEQVMQLRRKVINRVKAKTLNGKKLTGTMLASLAESYVVSINNGAVPNIENAWSYICKSECHKAIDESLLYYENVLRESVVQRIPMDDDELREVCNEAKKEALAMFSKKAVGSIADEFVGELKKKIKSLYLSIKEENERESAHACQLFLAESYSFIERKLRSKETTFAEFENDLKNFQQYFLDNGPPGTHRRLIMLEFVQRALTEAADYFQKTILNELQLQQAIQQDQHRNLETQVKELKSDHLREKDHFEQKLRSIEVEKAELGAIEQSLRENLDRLQQEKNSIERELTQKLDRSKKESQREIEEFRQKLGNTETVISDLQRKVYQTQSENEKERALLEQKVEFLERTIQDYQKKESEYSTELKREKKDHQQLSRDLQQKYETQIKQLSVKLDETQDKLLEVQSQYEEIDQKYQYEKQKWEEGQASMKNTMVMSQGQYNEMQRQMDDLKSKSRVEIEKLTAELLDIKENSRHREDELDSAVRDKDDEIKSMRNMFDKETAIFKQKLEFKDVQAQQLKSQLDESRKSHEQMVRAIESKARESYDGKEIAQKQLEQLKEIHTLEMKDALEGFNQARTKLEEQVEQLNEKLNVQELKFKMLKADSDKEIDGLRQQVENADKQKQRALDQTKNLDSQKLKLLEEADHRHKCQILQLEKELEEVNLKSQQEFREIQEKSEESLAQLKNFYEIEKERLEHRLAEEKDRAIKKQTQLQEEFDQRIRDESQQHEEDIEMLQEELRENERRHQSYTNQIEHENALMQQKIETLESYLKEKEERLSKEQSITATQIEGQMERFNTERKELFVKIEQLNQTLTNKERELTVLKNKLETALEEADKKKKSVEDIKSEFNQEKLKLNEKIEQLRTKNQEITDEFMQKKLEDGREIALYRQKLEFQQKKIDDNQRQYDDLCTRYDERSTSLKQEYQQELQETVLKMNQQKEQLEAKYEQKRKAFKEQENIYQKQITEIQKEKAVLEEKFVNSELKKDEQKIKQTQEIEFLKEQVAQASEQLGRDREVFVHENERLKAQVQELEREFSEVQSSYERDKALWDGKFQFLEQQKDQAKSDLQEATKKFEMTLEQLQKRGSADRDKIENSQNFLLQSIEQKYRQQMREQLDQNQRLSSELSEKVKYLEKENIQLQNRLQLELRDQMSEHGSMEKKVQDLQEAEARYHKEIDELKSERDRRIVDNQRALDKERETFKTKIQDIEQKCKELESKRSTMFFEFEKEKAKWGLEKDFLTSQKQEVQEQVERVQRKQEQLLKENERLKSEKTRQKSYLYGQGNAGGAQGANGVPPTTGGQYASKFNSTAFGQHLLKGTGAQKENIGVGSSQTFAQGFAKFISDGAQKEGGQSDQSSLPYQANPQSSLKGLFGNTVNSSSLLGLPNKQSSSGAGSIISGGNGQFGGASSTDETTSIN